MRINNTALIKQALEQRGQELNLPPIIQAMVIRLTLLDYVASDQVVFEAIESGCDMMEKVAHSINILEEVSSEKV